MLSQPRRKKQIRAKDGHPKIELNMHFSHRNAGFPQAFCLCSRAVVGILGKLQASGIRKLSNGLQMRLAYANLEKLSVSSGASRWPGVRDKGLPRLREVGSWFVGSGEVSKSTPEPL